MWSLVWVFGCIVCVCMSVCEFVLRLCGCVFVCVCVFVRVLLCG